MSRSQLRRVAVALGRHLDVRIQVRSFEAVCRMVGAGVGIGLVPRSAVTLAGLGEPPVVLAMDEPWAQRDLEICVRKGAVLSGFAATLVAHLRRSGSASHGGRLDWMDGQTAAVMPL